MRRAVAVKVAVALVLGVVGVFAPHGPTFRTERAMATETRRPLSEGASVQPAPAEPPVAEQVGPPGPGGDPAASTTTTTTPDDTSTTTARPTTTSSTGPTSTTTTVPAVVPPDSRVQVTEDTRDYDLIGVTLPEAPATPVYVRPGHDDGTWGEWTALEFGDAATPAAEPLPGVDVPQEPDETSPGAHSEPYWVGDASSYQLDITAAQAEVAQVHLVYETTRQVAVAETRAGRCRPRPSGGLGT